MLIRPEILNKVILTYEDYIELMGLPEGSNDDSQRETRITKWINQATQQFDSLISAQGQAGKIFNWFDNLDLTNEEDKMKGYKLQLAIAQWVETFIISGKFWVDNVPSINSNFNVEINSSSQDSAVEYKRVDILQSLASIGLYNFSNLLKEGPNTQTIKQEEEAFWTRLMNYLEQNFVRLKPQKALEGPLNIANAGINNTGNLDSGRVGVNLATASGYQFLNCAFNKEEITSLKTDMILDPVSGKYKKINMFDVEYFGGMKKQEIIDTIASLTYLYDENVSYSKDTVVKFLTSDGHLAWALSLRNNNKGNNPETSPLDWRVLPNEPIDIDAIVNEIKPLLPREIQDVLNEFPEINVFSTTQSDERYLRKPDGETGSNLAFTDKRNDFALQQTFRKYITVQESGTFFGGVKTTKINDGNNQEKIDLMTNNLKGNWKTNYLDCETSVKINSYVDIDNQFSSKLGTNAISVKNYVESKLSGGGAPTPFTITLTYTGTSIDFSDYPDLNNKYVVVLGVNFYNSDTEKQELCYFSERNGRIFNIYWIDGNNNNKLTDVLTYSTMTFFGFTWNKPTPSSKKQKVKANKKSPKALARQKRQERRYKNV